MSQHRFSALVFSAGLGALFASAALAQSPSDFLPREPDVAPAPEREVTPPEEPQDTGPATPVADGGPAFPLGGIVVDGATALGQSELEPIWSGLIGQPVTLATLDDVAARIGAAYRARGFILAQALLPAQTVEGGIVHIQVIEGFIDTVAITGGADNQQDLAEQYFAPVTQEHPLRLQTLERAVLLTRDSLGGEVSTVLEPSATTFAAASLGVLAEPDPVSFFATADNRGSRLYGQLTLGGGARSYNLLGLNERLDATLALAPEDTSLAYASLLADTPLPALQGGWLDGGRLELSGDISRADPDLTQSGSPDSLTVVLDETNLRAGLIVPFIRTRSQNLFGRLGLGFRNSRNETAFDSDETDYTDRLAILDGQLTWDVADLFGGVNLVDAGFRQGLDAFGAEVGADGPAAGVADFTLGFLNLSRLQRLGSSDWSLFGFLTGQYAANTLPASERFTLGDATVGRGFAPGNTAGDSGWGGRLELRYLLRGEDMGGHLDATELYAFGDYGIAYDRSVERDGEREETLASAGIGARIDISPRWTLTPEIARQLRGTATDTTETDHETRFYIGLVGRF